MTAVTPLNSRTVLGLNQEAYQQLRLALSVNLRRQLLIAVCDDTALQHQLADRLQEDLGEAETTQGEWTQAVPTIVNLSLESQDPDLVRQVVMWIKQHGVTPTGTLGPTPTFQILGIDRLTRHSPAIQNRFLTSLTRLEALLARLDLRLVIWVSRPWLRKIRQSVPGVWRLRNGLFEFAGDPTPLVPIDAAPVRPVVKSQPAPQQASLQPPLETSTRDFWTILTEDLSALEETAAPAPDLPQAAPIAAVSPSPESKADGLSPIQPKAEPVPAQPPVPTIPPTIGSLLLASSAADEQATPAAPPVARPASQEQAQESPSLISWTDGELLALLQQIQSLVQQQVGPLTLAHAYLALGQACRDRIEAGNLNPALINLALEAYTQALPGFPEGTPEWCDGLNDLGSLYWLRSHGESQPEAVLSWLKQSVQAYQRALNHPQSQPSTDSLVRMCSNLGTVYSLLANYEEPAQNLEHSVRAYHRALQQRSPETFPLEYAALQNSLGAVQWRMSQLGNARHHLHQAITAYSEALRYRPPQTYPQEYGMVQNNLGIAYWSLAQHERPVFLLEQSIIAYQAALAYRTLTSDPAGCAATQNNLGTVYWDLAQHQAKDPERQLNLWQQSVIAYENALEAAHRAMEQTPTATLNFDLWATFHSAGVVHDQLAQHLSADETVVRGHHLDQALFYYITALKGWRSQPERLALLKAALGQNIRLQFQIRGLEGQTAALSQIPGDLLPDILPHL